ncbi:MAG: ankyrin repeat domain-containing protein [Wolbachia sp.]
MNSGQEKKAIDSGMRLYWQNIFSYIKQGDRESAERTIDNLISNNKWKSKEVYNCLLVIAATQGDIQVAEFCKNRGANLDYVSDDGRTPLWLARENGKNQMVETLEKWGARGDTDKYCGKPSPKLIKPDYRDEIEDFYYGTLSSCFEKGLSKENLVKTVEDFVQNKGYCIKETYGEFLLCSVAKRDIKIAEFCKESGADLNYKGYSGRTPLEVSERLKYCKMVEILREWGAHQDNKFWSKLPFSRLKDPKQEKQRGCTEQISCNLM